MFRLARVCCFVACLGFFSSTTGNAASSRPRLQAPPLASTPAMPMAPPIAPRGLAPPVLKLTLPTPHLDAPSVLGALGSQNGAGPSLGVPPGPPDLTDFVDLPGAVNPFPGHAAQPFGGTPPEDQGPPVVPEPTTSLLMLLGLGGLARVGRPRA